MEIKLIEALDYKKVEELLKEEINDTNKIHNIIKELKKIENARRSEITSAAGRLSRFPGDVLEIIGLSEEKTHAQNISFTKRVIGYGHDSISDHDYCVFGLKDVSPLIEQIIIAERFSSFTIKSRREVDFSKAGFYTPDFHDKTGKILEINDLIKSEYQDYIEGLFASYSNLVENNIPKEDARFILPYCYHSNIIMGVDAHTLKDMIIKFTKTKYANIQEVKELGEKLYKIAEENMPYIIEEIDKQTITPEDSVEKYLSETISKEKYKIIDKPTLINKTKDIDDTILISAIMRRYQYDFSKAKKIYKVACEESPNFKEELMRKIAFEGDKLELTQVNFEFQIPLSFAVLTHLTRHRTHHLIVPDFTPNVDLTQYKIPPTINKVCKDMYDEIFASNKKMYDHFKNDYGIREEDLVYFTLSGNMVNVTTNMDGKTLEHILKLRECNKTQWETRKMSNEIHKEISSLEDAKYFASILGSTCMTQGICNEGKECCGKVYVLTNNKK